MATSSISRNAKPQVFINFRGAELRSSFVPYLHKSLHRKGINAFIDNDERPGEDLVKLFERIEESTVAVAILSSRYTESHWCLDELVKIKECVDRRTLWVIPIFYKLKTSIVQNLEGSFGLQLWELWRNKDHHSRDHRILKWDAALQDVRRKKALRLEENSNEVTFVDEITKHIENFLSEDKRLREENRKPQGREGENLKPQGREGENLKPQGRGGENLKPQGREGENLKPQGRGGENLKPQGRGGENPKPEEDSNRASSSIKPVEQRLKQMEEKVDVDCNYDETRIGGVVGMVGIGKTYLPEKLYVPKLNEEDSLELLTAQICTTIEGKLALCECEDLNGEEPLLLNNKDEERFRLSKTILRDDEEREERRNVSSSVKEHDSFHDSYLVQSIEILGVESVVQKWSMVPIDTKKKVEEKLKFLHTKEVEWKRNEEMLKAMKLEWINQRRELLNEVVLLIQNHN